MRPASGKIAAAQAAELARSRLSGISHATKKRRVRRAAIAAEAIWRRWHLGVRQWKLKHVRWFIEFHLREMSPNARYQYWLVVRDLVSILDHAHWIPLLKGSWTCPDQSKS